VTPKQLLGTEFSWSSVRNKLYLRRILETLPQLFDNEHRSTKRVWVFAYALSQHSYEAESRPLLKRYYAFDLPRSGFLFPLISAWNKSSGLFRDRIFSKPFRIRLAIMPATRFKCQVCAEHFFLAERHRPPHFTILIIGAYKSVSGFPQTRRAQRVSAWGNSRVGP